MANIGLTKSLIASSIIALAMAGTAPSRAQDVIDRVVAIVDGRPLLMSDTEDQLRFEALQQARDLQSLGDADLRAAREHLVEREIIRQQIHMEFQPSEAEVEEHINSLRKLFPEGQSEEGWKSVLWRYGFTENAVRNEIIDELRTMRLIDVRLRPTVRVEPSEIERYYNDVLVPAVRAKGAQADPLVQVRSKIEELLVQQKMNDVFAAWMTNLRNQSKVQFVGGNSGSKTPEDSKTKAAVNAETTTTKTN